MDIHPFPRFNLHNQLLTTLEITDGQIKNGTDRPLYCGAYRKVFDAKEQPAVECWLSELRVGDALPELPLFITPEVAVPVALETAYMRVYEGLKVFED